MGETTHTLKFRADSRAVKVAGQEIRKAFDPRSSREFRRELGGLQRRLKDVTSAQVTLVKELQRTEEGTNAYKKLAEQLGAVEDQAKTVKSAIGGITSAFKDFNAEKRRGFGAGLAQGMGVAQYIPSEAGMGRRIAGGVIGKGVRRAAGAAAAPLQQPGVGGLASMVGAIPIVGQMAAGQIHALAGMYQEAVAYHSARVENLQYIQGGAVDRSQRAMGAGVGAAAAFRLRAGTKIVGKGGHLTRQGRQMAGLARADLSEALSDPNSNSPYVKKARAAMEREQKRKIISQTIAQPIRDVEEVISNVGEIANFVGDKVGIQTGWKGGPKIAASRAQIGQKYKAARGAILDTISEQMIKDLSDESKKAARKDRAARFRKAFGRVTLPSAGFGARFGFRAAETQAELSSFMGARGGEYTGLARHQFEGSLAARRVYGVQAQSAGAFARMGQGGGGGRGTMGLATVLQTAFTMGLRGAQIPELLQSLVGLGQQAEQTGVKIDERSFTRQAGLMGAIGIKGPQMGRIAGGVNRAAMDLSGRGVSSPADMIMLRAAGYDPSQGIEGYSAAMNKMAGGMDMPMLQNLMEMATAGSTGGVGGAGKQTSILMMRRFFGRLKTPIGPGQASEMLEAYQSGKLGREHLALLNRNIETGERRGAHGRMVTGARVGVGMVAGLTKTEAGLEAKRIALGSRMAGTMATLNTASLAAAGAVANFSGELRTVANWMASFTKDLEKATKGGADGLWAKITKELFGGK
jgi:hypothetical protein